MGDEAEILIPLLRLRRTWRQAEGLKSAQFKGSINHRKAVGGC
jgi:hypothetical protein